MHKTNNKRGLHMTNTMTEEAKKARREYYKKWRKDHPGKDKEYHARYWTKKAAQEESSAEGARA